MVVEHDDPRRGQKVVVTFLTLQNGRRPSAMTTNVHRSAAANAHHRTGTVCYLDRRPSSMTTNVHRSGDDHDRRRQTRMMELKVTFRTSQNRVTVEHDDRRPTTGDGRLVGCRNLMRHIRQLKNGRCKHIGVIPFIFDIWRRPSSRSV